MNRLLINQHARNHIKIFPLYKGAEIPEDEGDQIRWAKAQFEELQQSNEAERLFIYRSNKKGFLVSVWRLHDLYYIVQCIRNEFRTYNTIIYINNEKEDSINIAKFLQANAITIMKDYKQQILDAKDYIIEGGNAKQIS